MKRRPKIANPNNDPARVREKGFKQRLHRFRRMRRVNAVVQTDPVHTKLMKEVSTDEQTDLIPMVDEEILTDGNLVIREVGNCK